MQISFLPAVRPSAEKKKIKTNQQYSKILISGYFQNINR